jgi:hypothetical protein
MSGFIRIYLGLSIFIYSNVVKGQNIADSALLSEINKIKAIDNHLHDLPFNKNVVNQAVPEFALGKTHYIRYLLTSVRKNVIFLPPNLAGAITNPDLISILIDNPNSIFVIEDAD